MPKLEFTLQTISPLFLNGGSSKQPDLLRAASIRGQLRYWYRAFKGVSFPNTSALFSEEEKIFGSTAIGSPVTIRLYADSEAEIASVPMLPHRSVNGIGEGGNPSRAEAIVDMSDIHLQFVTRPGVRFPLDFLKALATWQLVGGVGKRSRRTFGALQHHAWQASEDASFFKPLRWWDKPLGRNSVDDFAAILQEHFAWIIKAVDPAGTTRFPTLDPASSRVIVTRVAYDDATEANQAAFYLIRSRSYPAAGKPYHDYKNLGPFGGVGRPIGRLASPLHVQVRRLKNRYHLVFTAMANTCTDEHRHVLSQFMQDATDEFEGITVWGNL